MLIAYRDEVSSNFGTAIVATITLGDTIGYGAPVVFQSTTTDYISTTTLDPTTVLIAYQDASQPDARAIVGTISGGDVVTFGTAVCFNAASTLYIAATATDSTHVAIAYRHGGNSAFGTSIVATVNGTNISFGIRTIFNSDDSRFNSATTLDSSHVLTACRDFGNGGFDTATVGETSATLHFRSIGTAADYFAGTVTATCGSTLVTGSGVQTWLGANRGRGDRIDIGGTDYTVQPDRCRCC